MEAVILEASVCGTHLYSERLLNTMLYIKVSTLIATGQEVVVSHPDIVAHGCPPGSLVFEHCSRLLLCCGTCAEAGQMA